MFAKSLKLLLTVDSILSPTYEDIFLPNEFTYGLSDGIVGAAGVVNMSLFDDDNTELIVSVVVVVVV